MVVERGQVWWADLGEPTGSASGFRRPLLVVQDDAFNRSGSFLTEPVGRLRGQLLKNVDSGLRLGLGL